MKMSADAGLFRGTLLSATDSRRLDQSFFVEPLPLLELGPLLALAGACWTASGTTRRLPLHPHLPEHDTPASWETWAPNRACIPT
jgi:hypothetical protein